MTKPTPGQNTTTARTTTINELPTELLQPIVNYLSYKDRLNVANVSARWHNIVDEHLGRKLFVGRPCQFSPEDEERYKHHYVPITNLNKVGVNTLYVGEVVEPIASAYGISYYWMRFKEKIFGSPLPTFKHPHLVKHIFFDGPIPPQYFDSLLTSAKTLMRLDIHFVSLSCLTPDNMRLGELNKLTTINIWGHKLAQGLFSQFYSTAKIIGNLITLLDNNTFPHLKNLAMEYPFDLRDETNLTESLLEFLKKHNSSLEKIKLSINIFTTEDPTNFDSTDDRSWLLRAKTASRLLKLKHVEFNITSLFRVRLSKMWIGFIESQNALESVSVMTFHLQPDLIFRLCEQNYKVVKEMSLSRLVINDNGRYTPINCSAFERCKQLNHLFLEALLHGPQAPGLVNVASLPKSLSKIELGGLRMASEDAHILLTEFPNLQDMFLFDLGSQDRLGVTADTMVEVFRNRKIKAITMYGSLNGYPAEGLNNGSPTDPHQIVSRAYGIFEIKLSEEGYYIAVPHLAIPDIIMEDMD